MAAFYLDNDVSHLTARYLRQMGHDVTTTRDLHLQRQHDYEQIITATDQNRVLLTHNEKDFVLLYRAWHYWAKRWHISPSHSVILVVPQLSPGLARWDPESAAHELTRFVRELPEFSNLLFVWHARDGWTLSPPP